MFRQISRLLERIRWSWQLSATELGNDDIEWLCVLAKTEPELAKKPASSNPIREVLAGIIGDEPLKFPKGASNEAMMELASSANRVKGELFWKVYLDAVSRLEDEALGSWRQGKIPEEAAKAMSWLLDALPKLTAIVTLLHQKVQARDEDNRRREYWRRVAEEGRWKHG
jgi:hypothetical protein